VHPDAAGRHNFSGSRYPTGLKINQATAEVGRESYRYYEFNPASTTPVDNWNSGKSKSSPAACTFRPTSTKPISLIGITIFGAVYSALSAFFSLLFL
jgi:hypothetical protein